ncbi:DUF1652 domain-containing protein [Pseudomonas gingeri NCPPB 3146 = LMG 5327]|uniref:DUF1652 domain-containing protein n=2 Tax=Pseudomonas gingeri TaxID=117681 RepID=A0A7Y8CB36_9PSED|nr:MULTISPECIES: DUF1652 domain-containing protein [Pseudomonas]NVZ29467.1 DUF1652 domain-containing protein [Pseudomonas gingeri]NVZ66730.1 DUF1652 domain-containing protein [Pseudomonas gingeri]NVZ75088.1 DUF1652 domain-containing protein [Pseudomonas gingeri]NWA08682.1 DUF1652 domain-containing protein [Pseudomonas gingeri]NWC12790.1 DUF1652 domain-containing protein [Pseudomonas gingeri]
MFPVDKLCQTIESGFLPLSCTCTVNGGGALMIKIFDPVSGRVDLQLNGVSTSSFTSVRSVANFIGELRTEMKAGRRAFAGSVI